ncbi:MAG TPA: hypothetical protein DEB23_09770 [Chitinophagaceae bacterium]|nr:hypothetical protein [Chitinophagaceae bacterium]
MGRKFIFTAVFISFSILGVAQIPVLSVEKNIFKMDSVFEKEAVSKGYYRSFNRWIRQADFDNDGLLDYLLQPYQNINRGGVISVYYNKSTATKTEFKNTNKANLYSEGDPGLFDVGDVDGDNRADILLPTQNYHGKPENKQAEWYTNNPEHTFDKLFLNKGDYFKRVLFPNNYNTESGRLLNINNTPQKEIIISNYDKPQNTDPNHQDPNLLYKYGLINEELYRGTTLRGTDLDLLSRAVQSDEKGGKIFFAIEKRLINFKDSIFIISFNKGDSLSLISKHDTVAIITSEKKQKGDYFYNYLPVIDFGIHVVDMDNDGIYEVVTQEFTQIKDLTGKSVELDLGLSHTRIQVYNKYGNISNQWLDSALQYDPVRIAHGNGIKVEDLNNDGLVDILPVNGWGWWGWDNGDTIIKKELLNKRVLLNTGKKIQGFKLDFKNDSDFQALKMGWFFYPIYNISEKSANILFLSEGGETTFSNWDNTNGIAKIDLSQFRFPCDVYKPVINIHGLTSIPYNDSKTKIYVDTIDGMKTIWYKNNKIIGNTNSITINETGDYKIVRTNLGGCVNEKPFTVEKEGQVALRLKTFSISINDSNANRINNMGIGGPLEYSVSGSILYSIAGIEHIIGTPALGEGGLPPIHLINKSGNWQLENIYPEAAMGNARNYVFVDSTTIAYADHGLESGNPWPYGDIWTVKNSNDKLKWTKISKYKSFYHSVAVGDLDLDGKYDLMGLHMGSYDPWKGIGGLHPYIQQNDTTFIDGVNTMILPTSLGFVAGPGAVAIKDILGDKHPEIIVTQYGSSGDAYGYLIYAYSSISKAYEFYKKANTLGVFSEAKQEGANSTSIKLADFDKDGIDDMAIATEGYPNGKIQIWLGKKDGIFEPDQILNYSDTSKGSYPDSSNAFREFEVSDVDKDGWLDIIVHPSNFGTQFRINPGPNGPHYTDNGWRGYGIKLQASIWRNTKGTFNYLTNDLSIPGIYPGYVKGFFVNNKLKFFGFQNTGSYSSQATLSEKHKFNLYEMTVTFCKNLIKPTFSTTKYDFCSGDSLKLTISNINKGDSLKWYYGTKSDLTNLSNKTFTDSTKLFVTRTDSLGCVISSDTIQIKKYGIPSAPSITRDTANFLLSGALGTTWYKDGSVITDTAQKYKPTTAGSYTAKTTTNGCTSVMSSAYYYLVTDIINLSKDEFIKLAPNPFINQLNFDFIVKGYQKLNIEVYDVATGSKVAIQQNITAGTKIQLGQLARGTYIVRVTSNDNKIAQQFKMVKL